MNDVGIDIDSLLAPVCDTTAAPVFGYTGRRLTELVPELCSRDISTDRLDEIGDEIIDLGKNLKSNRKILPTLSAAEELKKKINLPKILIDGLLYQNDIMAINAPSKSGKSFFLLHLAICLGAGKSWLGFSIENSCKILFLNFEVSYPLFLCRIKRVSEALNVPIPENFHFYSPLGGESVYQPISNILPPLINTIEMEKFDVIFIDPLYKIYDLAGNLDENSNSDMARLFDNLDRICIETGATIIYTHHYAKGQPGRKFAIDRASGAGTLARAPDAILNLTELDSGGTMPAYRIEPILRNFASDWTIDVRWDYPIHVVADDLSNCDLKSRPGRPSGSQNSESKIEAAWLECCDGDGVATINSVKNYLGFGSYGTFFRAIKNMKHNPYDLRVTKTEIRGKKLDKKINFEEIFSEH